MVDVVNVLRPCLHQVAGHLFEEGKAGSFVDDLGHFYKPLQKGPRGGREREFYESIASDLAAEHLWRRSSLARRPSLRSPPSLPDLGAATSRGDTAQRDEWGLVGSPSGSSASWTSDGGASPRAASDDEENGTSAALMAGGGSWQPDSSDADVQGAADAVVLVSPRRPPQSPSPFSSGEGEPRSGPAPKVANGTSPGAGSATGGAAVDGDNPAASFSTVHAPLLGVIPRFYGVVTVGGRNLLELEDLARGYRRPCIVDIKIGYRTWYPEAGDEAYIARCKQKDAATTQSRLGFKICGMQVWRSSQGGYWRASKRWCKTLPEALVDKALLSFANNEHGLRPRDVFGGPRGAVAHLQNLMSWVSHQRTFRFYSSSILLLYEGHATGADTANVQVRLVDFAHSFRSASTQRDDNFFLGLASLTQRLQLVQGIEVANTLV